MGSSRLSLLVLVIVVNLIVLSPMLECGYVGDDLFNSSERGYEITSGLTTWQAYCEAVDGWFNKWGRFFPIALTYIPFFSNVTSRETYRVLGLLLILSNVLLFA